MPDYSLGVDIGGTFTDIVVYDHANNSQLNRKVLTTHDDPSRAVIEGVAHLLDAFALDPADFSRFVHATTLFTNALVERRGARTEPGGLRGPPGSHRPLGRCGYVQSPRRHLIEFKG